MSVNIRCSGGMTPHILNLSTNVSGQFHLLHSPPLALHIP